MVITRCGQIHILALLLLMIANNFTSNAPISCNYYKGDNSAKWDMIELARLSTNELVEWLDWCLDANDVGINIKDLGFTAY